MFEILVVDDEAIFRDAMCEQLKEKFKDAWVTTATSGSEAIQVLQAGRWFDIIICDYKMPEGLGTDVLRYLMRKNLNIYFILHTSHLVTGIPDLPQITNEYFMGIVGKMEWDELIETVSLCREKNRNRKQTM